MPKLSTQVELPTYEPLRHEGMRFDEVSDAIERNYSHQGMQSSAMARFLRGQYITTVVIEAGKAQRPPLSAEEVLGQLSTASVANAKTIIRESRVTTSAVRTGLRRDAVRILNYVSEE